jgi:hypothetical protein
MNGRKIYEGDKMRDNDADFDEEFIAEPPCWFKCDAFNVYGYQWTDRFIDNYDDPTDNRFVKHCEVIT